MIYAHVEQATRSITSPLARTLRSKTAGRTNSIALPAVEDVGLATNGPHDLNRQPRTSGLERFCRACLDRLELAGSVELLFDATRR